ncbi:hypothetical protein [Endozoicomonas sp. 8E]|nr:hypothetical protein [Endozoicomonas sp. 8E]WOG25547.1 hypothetical protein P6910_13235 [Endozoicomonas sp. 8E]
MDSRLRGNDENEVGNDENEEFCDSLLSCGNFFDIKKSEPQKAGLE